MSQADDTTCLECITVSHRLLLLLLLLLVADRIIGVHGETGMGYSGETTLSNKVMVSPCGANNIQPMHHTYT
jgi:hypothetical protein